MKKVIIVWFVLAFIASCLALINAGGVKAAAPSLSNGDCSLADTTFTFEVTYTDADGDAPFDVKVYIDEYPQTMNKVSGTYAGGATYRYTASHLSAGSHTYYFVADYEAYATPIRFPVSGTFVTPEAPGDSGSQPITILVVIGIVTIVAVVGIVFAIKK